MSGTVEFMAETSVSVVCAECGYDLSISAEADDESRRHRGSACINVMPCPDCIEKARQEARQEAKQEERRERDE